MSDPVRFWLKKVAGFRETDIGWNVARLKTKVYRKRVLLEQTPLGKMLKVRYDGSPAWSSRYKLSTKTGALACYPPASYAIRGTYTPRHHRDKYVKCLSLMERVITCRSFRCKRLRYYLKGLRSVVGANPRHNKPRLPKTISTRCPPLLAHEGTIKQSMLKRPPGKQRTVMSVDADFSFNIKGNPYNERHMLHGCYASGSDRHVCYGGLDSVLLDSARTRSSPPVVSGVGYPYIGVWRNLMKATHVVVKVAPMFKGFIILEIYDADDLGVYVQPSKNPRNKWLPRKGVDLFKVRIPINPKPSRGWQTLVVPLSAFVDWNRKRTRGCTKYIKGVNEDIGDGVLNPLMKESFQFQVVLEAEKPGAYAQAYIGKRVRFVKYLKARTK